MGASKDRLELTIDVLNKPEQHALALADLTPEELIAATLQEFSEIEYLGIDPADYRLMNAGTGKELDGSQPIHTQLSNKDSVKLAERERPVPSGGHRPATAIYLREMASGRVFKLHWLPAIIGRPDRNLPDNQLLAANLEMLPSGLRVSRRHAMIGEQNGQYFVQCLSGNPATLRCPNGETRQLTTARVPISSEDVLYLDRSEIALKLIVLSGSAKQPAATPAETGTTDAATVPGEAGVGDNSTAST